MVAVLLMLGSGDRRSRRPGQAGRGQGRLPRSTSPININTATAAQLETLPGIGARTAQAIVDHRQKNGSFKKIEELMNVKGIGEKSFLKLKPMVMVTADKADKAGDRQ